MRIAWIIAMARDAEWFEALERQGTRPGQRYKTLPHASEAVVACFELGSPLPLQLLPLLGTPLTPSPSPQERT